MEHVSKNCRLSVQGLEKSYDGGSTKALRSFSAAFEHGVYGILGPNGAGKSTLFRLLTGTLLPDAGAVFWKEQAIGKDWLRYKSAFGYMPQQQQLYPEMTVGQFLRYFAALKGLPKAQINSQIHQAMVKTGLTCAERTRVGVLSGGMKQRVLLSQALLGDPELLILDEPTAGLDPMERVRVRNFIGQIAIDKTVLIATHVVSDIECIAKKVFFLKAGEVILSGSPADILSMHRGKVFEGDVEHVNLPRHLSQYNITQLQETSKGNIHIKVCGDFVNPPAPEGQPFKLAETTLTDVYLYLFGQKGHML